MQLNSILTVLDKPKHRQSALHRSVTLQTASAADLDLVVFRWDAQLDHGDVFDAKQRRRLRHQVNEKCSVWQQGLIDQEQLDRQHTQARMIWTRDIAHWLTEESQQASHDLIVKSALREKHSLLLTPLDWQIIRQSHKPILFASHRRRKKTSGRVLVALDFKHKDARHRRMNSKLLAAAKCFADLSGTQIHCVFVLEISEVLRDLDVLDTRVSKQAILKTCMPQIERTLAGYQIPQSRLHFPVGKPSQLIAAKAHQLDADLLVVGTWAHKIREAIGLGNTAEKILGKSPCDILTVHP